MRFSLTILVAGLAATTLAAQTPRPHCDQADAAARWDGAVAAGIVQGASMLNRMPTIHVRARDWAGYPLEVRLGMIATLDCAAGGGTEHFREIQIVDEGGRVLARWDGIRRRLDVQH